MTRSRIWRLGLQGRAFVRLAPFGMLSGLLEFGRVGRAAVLGLRSGVFGPASLRPCFLIVIAAEFELAQVSLFAFLRRIIVAAFLHLFPPKSSFEALVELVRRACIIRCTFRQNLLAGFAAAHARLFAPKSKAVLRFCRPFA